MKKFGEASGIDLSKNTIKGGLKKENIDKKLQSVFDKIDTDNNGVLDDTEIKNFKAAVDTDKSNFIDQKEAKAFLYDSEGNPLTYVDGNGKTKELSEEDLNKFLEIIAVNTEDVQSAQRSDSYEKPAVEIILKDGSKQVVFDDPDEPQQTIAKDAETGVTTTNYTQKGIRIRSFIENADGSTIDSKYADDGQTLIQTTEKNGKETRISYFEADGKTLSHTQTIDNSTKAFEEIFYEEGVPAYKNTNNGSTDTYYEYNQTTKEFRPISSTTQKGQGIVEKTQYEYDGDTTIITTTDNIGNKTIRKKSGDVTIRLETYDAATKTTDLRVRNADGSVTQYINGVKQVHSEVNQDALNQTKNQLLNVETTTQTIKKSYTSWEQISREQLKSELGREPYDSELRFRVNSLRALNGTTTVPKSGTDIIVPQTHTPEPDLVQNRIKALEKRGYTVTITQAPNHDFFLEAKNAATGELLSEQYTCNAVSKLKRSSRSKYNPNETDPITAKCDEIKKAGGHAAVRETYRGYEITRTGEEDTQLKDRGLQKIIYQYDTKTGTAVLDAMTYVYLDGHEKTFTRKTTGLHDSAQIIKYGEYGVADKMQRYDNFDYTSAANIDTAMAGIGTDTKLLDREINRIDENSVFNILDAYDNTHNTESLLEAVCDEVKLPIEKRFEYLDHIFGALSKKAAMSGIDISAEKSQYEALKAQMRKKREVSPDGKSKDLSINTNETRFDEIFYSIKSRCEMKQKGRGAEISDEDFNNYLLTCLGNEIKYATGIKSQLENNLTWSQSVGRANYHQNNREDVNTTISRNEALYDELQRAIATKQDVKKVLSKYGVPYDKELLLGFINEQNDYMEWQKANPGKKLEIADPARFKRFQYSSGALFGARNASRVKALTYARDTKASGSVVAAGVKGIVVVVVTTATGGAGASAFAAGGSGLLAGAVYDEADGMLGQFTRVGDGEINAGEAVSNYWNNNSTVGDVVRYVAGSSDEAIEDEIITGGAENVNLIYENKQQALYSDSDVSGHKKYTRRINSTNYVANNANTVIAIAGGITNGQSADEIAYNVIKDRTVSTLEDRAEGMIEKRFIDRLQVKGLGGNLATTLMAGKAAYDFLTAFGGAVNLGTQQINPGAMLIDELGFKILKQNDDTNI